MASESREGLAEERTREAFERSLLAKERTFSAWVRTGLAAVATGFALAKLLSTTHPQWLVRALCLVFVLTGGTIFALGFFSYRKMLRRMEEEGARGIPVWFIGALTLALMVGVGIGLSLILLE